MKLRFTRRATQDIASIAGYISDHNPAAAARMRAAIYVSLQNLIYVPRVGGCKDRGSAQIRDVPLRIYRSLPRC